MIKKKQVIYWIFYSNIQDDARESILLFLRQIELHTVIYAHKRAFTHAHTRTHTDTRTHMHRHTHTHVGSNHIYKNVSPGCDTRWCLKVVLMAVIRQNYQSSSTLPLLGSPQALGNKHHTVEIKASRKRNMILLKPAVKKTVKSKIFIKHKHKHFPSSQNIQQKHNKNQRQLH